MPGDAYGDVDFVENPDVSEDDPQANASEIEG